MKRQIVIIMLSLLLFLPAFFSGLSVSGESQGIWPMFRNNALGTSFTSEIGPSTNNVLWTFATQDDIRSSPAVVDNRVYVGSDDGFLYSIDVESGNQIWKTYAGKHVYFSSPAVANNQVFIGGGTAISCFSTVSGELRWTYSTGSLVTASPTVVDDRVYISSWDKKIYCFTADPIGDIDEPPLPILAYDLIWEYQTGNLVMASLTVYNGRVFVGSTDKSLYCLDAEDGTKIWSVTIGSAIKSSAAVSDDKVFVGSDNGNVYCFNATTGNQIWSYSTQGSVVSSPAVFNGRVYVGSYDGKLYCLNEDTGELLWSFTTGHAISSSPSVNQEYVYIGSKDKNLYCLDAMTGAKIWEYSTGGFIDYSSAAIANGKVFVGSGDNKLYCFGATPQNNPPTTPSTPAGSTLGFVDVEYGFTTSASDPDGDPIYCMFDWGDDSTSGWLGPYTSGESVLGKHTWTEPGMYQVRVKAKDSFGAESSFSSALSVSIELPIDPLKFFSIDAPISVQGGSVFTIVVTNRDTGVAVPGAQVEFFGEEQITDNQGTVSFIAPQVTANIQVVLIVRMQGYQQESMLVIVRGTTPARGWLYGRVTNVHARPLAASVCIAKANTVPAVQRCYHCDDDGYYTIALAPGSYTVKISKPGYTLFSSEIQISLNQTTQLNTVLEGSVGVKPTEPVNQLIEYAINQKVKENIIGARIYASPEQATVSVYSDTYDVTGYAQLKNQILFTMSASADAPGTIVVVRVDRSVLDDLNNILVFYDGIVLNESDDVEAFFDFVDNQDVGWIQLYRGDEVYVFVRVPEWSEHSIIITSVLPEVVSVVFSVGLYLVIIITLGMLTGIPIVRLWKKVE